MGTAGSDSWKSIGRAGAGLTSGAPLPGAFRCDLADDSITWTDGVYAMFGYAADRALDRREVVTLYDEQSREELELVRSAAIREQRPFTLDARIRSAGGVDRWIRITAIPEVRGGRTVALTGTKHDITAERASLAELRRLAFHDTLTGLANRARFHNAFLDRPAGCPTLDDAEALVLFDMDGFKKINDGWGHPAGDACLAVFAQRLRTTFTGARLIARIGGDEFAVLLDRDEARGPAGHRLRNAVPVLFAPFAWEGRLLPMQASAGMATTTGVRVATDPAHLYALADADLYRSKAAARLAPGQLRAAG